MREIMRRSLRACVFSTLCITSTHAFSATAMDGPQVQTFPGHGIQFSRSELVMRQNPRTADGLCDQTALRRVAREAQSCVLDVELARDSSSCTSLVERGIPVNTARCNAADVTDADGWHPLIDHAPNLAVSVLTLVMVSAYFERLGQGGMTPRPEYTVQALPPIEGNTPEFVGLR